MFLQSDCSKLVYPYVSKSHLPYGSPLSPFGSWFFGDFSQPLMSVCVCMKYNIRAEMWWKQCAAEGDSVNKHPSNHHQGQEMEPGSPLLSPPVIIPFFQRCPDFMKISSLFCFLILLLRFLSLNHVVLPVSELYVNRLI